MADGEAYPTYTVQVLDNHIENFKPKGLEGGVPTIDKKADGNQKNNAAIGDVVSRRSRSQRHPWQGGMSWHGQAYQELDHRWPY